MIPTLEVLPSRSRSFCLSIMLSVIVIVVAEHNDDDDVDHEKSIP